MMAANGMAGSVVGCAKGVKVAVATVTGVTLTSGLVASGVVVVSLLHAASNKMQSENSQFSFVRCNLFQVISPIILARDDKWCAIAADC